MGVAAYTQAAVDIAVGAGVCRLQVNDAFLKENEALGRLECGAGRVGAHQGAVEERPRLVVDKLAVVFATLAAYEQCGVVVWHRHHAENLARGRLYGHHGASLADHQRFGVLLQADVEAQAQVAARYRLDVARAVLISSLNAATGIAYEYLHSLYSAQVCFVAFLYAEVAGVVAGGVVVVALDVGR